MNPYKAVIADDEPAAIKVIATLLAQLAPDIAVSGTAADGLQAIRIITDTSPDIVFMDVDMPVLNGIRVMETLARPGMQVIFTTGSAEYALPALKLKAADYLLKPIDPAEFALAIANARSVLAQQRAGRPDAAATARLQLPGQQEIIFLDEPDICHVVGMGSYCQIHMQDGEKITVSRNIGYIERQLRPDLFYRCHNSSLVNLSLIARYYHRDGHFVEMKNGAVVEVSRRNKEGLLAAMAALMR